MHLNNIQLLKLAIPFILIGILYIFSDGLVSNVGNHVVTMQEYENKELETKAKVYLKIQKYKKIYVAILNRIELREKSRKWIVNHLLYNQKVFIKDTPSYISKKITKKNIWSLQILYANKKTAIINSQIVHEGSMINGAKVLDILQNKVLLETKQGKKWLFLFQ